MSKLSYAFIQAQRQAVFSKWIDRSFIEVDSRVGITVNSKTIIKTNGGALPKLKIDFSLKRIEESLIRTLSLK